MGPWNISLSFPFAYTIRTKTVMTKSCGKKHSSIVTLIHFPWTYFKLFIKEGSKSDCTLWNGSVVYLIPFAYTLKTKTVITESCGKKHSLIVTLIHFIIIIIVTIKTILHNNLTNIYKHLVNSNFNQFRYLYTCICYAEYGKRTIKYFFFKLTEGKIIKVIVI